MAKIFTEIIIIKKYEFCPEIWDIIKEYMGVYGIDLKLPYIMEKISGSALYQSNLSIFKSDKCTKFGSQKKSFYNNLKLLTPAKRSTACKMLINIYNRTSFKVPNGLKIGETILMYETYEGEPTREIGTVSTIGDDFFKIKIYENKSKSTYYTKTVKQNRKYIRKATANYVQLKYFEQD